MTIRNLSKKLILVVATSTLCCASALTFAAQNCNLGETCPVPGNDGGETHYAVTPRSGLNYLCELKSNGGSLKVLITSGKHFSLLQGGGFYNANPEAVVEVKGRFDKPENLDEPGEIRIGRVPFTAEGTVKCYAKQ